MQERYDRQRYEELELIPPVQGRAVLRAASFAIEAQETTSAFRVDARLRSVDNMNRLAVDAICDLDDYIALRAVDRHPAVVAGLRALQDVTAQYAARLIIHYVSRPL